MFGVVARRRAAAGAAAFTIPPSTSAFLPGARPPTTSLLIAGNHFDMAPQQQKRKQSSVPAGYKEDHSKGAMLRFEDSLPRLPVPTLEETAKRYLKSVHCLVNEEEYARTKKAVDDFVAPGGIGEKLQKRLQARADDPDCRNWLTQWWNAAAYLEYKDPVVPYVSYFYSHRDDRKRRDPAKRAAAIATGAIAFQKQVDEHTLEPEYMRKLPMAMNSYYWLFNSCRIPAKPADYPVKYDYKENAYAIVIRKNQFWKLPTHVGGTPLNTTELEEQFRRIYAAAEKSPGVGMLTTGNRDVWADMRSRLIEASPLNAEALRTIEASSFVICLDDASPVTLNERAHQYWHGDGANRFFDKPLQWIICDNGASGFNGEHSMIDGTPTHRANDWIMHAIATNQLDLDNPSKRSDISPPTPIRFELKGENLADIALATTSHVKVISQHELRVEAYQGFGKGLIKRFKCSPDGFVQMIIQLAYYRANGVCRPTYESAATRRFAEGRTETCRSVSDESVAFCTAMSHPLSTPEECRSLFRKALASQGQYIVDASDGKGVDRHLFGLKKCLESGEQLPEIFKDPAFSYSSSWYISSSQLSSEYYNGYGWSQVIDQGFGIAYMINENTLQFNIVSKGLGSEKMAFYINEAAGDIRDIMMPELEQQKAKL